MKHFRPKHSAALGSSNLRERTLQLVGVEEDGSATASYDGRDPLIRFDSLVELLSFHGMGADELELLSEAELEQPRG